MLPILIFFLKFSSSILVMLIASEESETRLEKVNRISAIFRGNFDKHNQKLKVFNVGSVSCFLIVVNLTH